jgi:hypothetical protein
LDSSPDANASIACSMTLIFGRAQLAGKAADAFGNRLVDAG